MKKIAVTSVTSNVVITDKDVRLLWLLGEAGAIKTAHAKTFYGDTSAYHLKRVQRLVAAGLLVHKHGYLQATAKGLKEAGYPNQPLRLAKHLLKEHALAVEVMSQLPGWTPTYARELKQNNLVQRSSRIAATITKGKECYAAYVLASEPKTITRWQLRAELTDLGTAGIDKALIFCTSPSIIKAFGNEPPASLKECCLLPYPQGVESFKRQSSFEFQLFVNTLFPGAKPSTRNTCDYEDHRVFITALLSNDLVKQDKLIKYIKSSQKQGNRRCVVICSPGQEIDIPDAQVIYDEPLADAKERMSDRHEQTS